MRASGCFLAVAVVLEDTVGVSDTFTNMPVIPLNLCLVRGELRQKRSPALTCFSPPLSLEALCVFLGGAHVRCSPFFIELLCPKQLTERLSSTTLEYCCLLIKSWWLLFSLRGANKLAAHCAYTSSSLGMFLGSAELRDCLPGACVVVAVQVTRGT